MGKSLAWLAPGMQPPEVSGETRCVDDEVLLEFARGELRATPLAQVEAHLQGCADCRAMLAEAARSLAHAEAKVDRAPTRIARYEVRELLGAGASGVVYKAFDPNLKRTVAIKVLRRDERSAPHNAERMLREAQAMARLSAPTVVAVFDVGVEHGAVFLVMEYVAGGTLARWLQSERRDFDAILTVFREAGRGLSTAHEKGLVHLDFKPENVLVDERGHARVTDFGLSREAGLGAMDASLDANGETSLYAPTRGLVGTPAYMAPELFDGGRASDKSDQFAFAVALFTALFERHPFGAGEGIALGELIVRTHDDAPRTLAELGLSGLRVERVHSVLSRALSADPSARFSDMQALLDALQDAARTGFSRPLALAVSASLLLILLALGFALRSSEPPKAARAPVAAEVTNHESVREATAPAPEIALEKSEPPPTKARVAPARAKVRPEKKKPEVRYRDGLKEPF